jgi:glucosamine--fructose-6-phosphate aminotransferase (isomerizing)
MTLREEIHQQPQAIARLIEHAPAFGRIAARLRADQLDHVLIAARGTSDHAAIYAQYLFGIHLGMPVGLATPSILSVYGAELRLARTLVIGISQSGASPDIVGVLEEGRRRGVPTVAITNDPASVLAGVADEVIDLGVGPELAVAATKTYTAELAALALLVAGMRDPADPLRADPALRDVPAAVAATLRTEPEVAAAAGELADRAACVVVGRGYEYATAREWALKLKELAHVVADPYSAADFRHGPVALVDEGFPVLAIAPSGKPAADMAALLARLRDELGASVLVLSDVPETRALGTSSVALPPLAEHLMPIASIVCGQLHALHATVARKHDPDHPRHIAKVTRTA